MWAELLFQVLFKISWLLYSDYYFFLINIETKIKALILFKTSYIKQNEQVKKNIKINVNDFSLIRKHSHTVKTLF